MSAAASTNSPRKETVRSVWNTPVLQAIRDQFHRDYLYCGLPGPEALDILLWRNMIRRVIAFELEDRRLRNPRQNLIDLTATLRRTGIPSRVFTGYLESAFLSGRDDNNEAFGLDEVVTLFNLDFCNAITGKIKQPGGEKCLRFAALRSLTSIQEDLLRNGGDPRFVILLTIREDCKIAILDELANRADLPEATHTYLQGLPPLARGGDGQQQMVRSSAHLKAFVFTMMRDYCNGRAISTHFLPMVKYVGHTPGSPMLHFTILCRYDPRRLAFPKETQTARDFLLGMSSRATDETIVREPCGDWETEEPVDNVGATQEFFGEEA